MSALKIGPATAIALLLAGCGGNQSDQVGTSSTRNNGSMIPTSEPLAEDTGVSEAAGDFYSHFGVSFEAYPVDAQYMLDTADLVVLGHVATVEPGPTFQTQLRTGVRESPTLVIAVEANRVLRGETTDGKAFFQMLYVPAHLGDIRESIPEEEVLVLLKPYPPELSENTQIVNDGAGYPDGVTERSLVAFEGWLTERDGRVYSPFVPDWEVVLHGETLDEIAHTIVDLD